MLTGTPESRPNLANGWDHRQCGSDKDCFWIRALYSGLPPRLKRRLRIAVLQAFFDDSGRGKLEPKNLIFVLAGYTASVDAFESFAHKWDDLLKEEPCLEYVKGKEANDLAGQFAGWTCEARDEKIATFISLIREHKLIALSVAMDYRAFNRHLREPKAPMNYPYGITFAHVVAWLLNSAALKPEPEEIELILDNGMIGRQRSIDAAYRGIQEGTTAARVEVSRTWQATFRGRQTIHAITGCGFISLELPARLHGTVSSQATVGVAYLE